MNVGEAIAIALVCLILGYALVSRLFRIVRGLSHLPRSLQLLMGSHSVKSYLEKEKPTESDVKITPTAEPGWPSPAPHIGALFGGVLVFIGVFLPWIQLGTLLTNRGIDNPDGAIVLAFSLIVICYVPQSCFGLGWRILEKFSRGSKKPEERCWVKRFRPGRGYTLCW